LTRDEENDNDLGTPEPDTEYSATSTYTGTCGWLTEQMEKLWWWMF
jgi:hypothetical protein